MNKLLRRGQPWKWVGYRTLSKYSGRAPVQVPTSNTLLIGPQLCYLISLFMWVKRIEKLCEGISLDTFIFLYNSYSTLKIFRHSSKASSFVIIMEDAYEEVYKKIALNTDRFNLGDEEVS